MDESRMTDLLNHKIEWMGKLYGAAQEMDMYQWVRADGIRHRCGGEVWVFVETTGIGYVCGKCEEAEVL